MFCCWNEKQTEPQVVVYCTRLFLNKKKKKKRGYVFLKLIRYATLQIRIVFGSESFKINSLSMPTFIFLYNTILDFGLNSANSWNSHAFYRIITTNWFSLFVFFFCQEVINPMMTISQQTKKTTLNPKTNNLSDWSTLH